MNKKDNDYNQSVVVNLETLTCPSCIAKIEGAIKKLDGVDINSMKVSFSSSRVKMNIDENLVSEDDIVNSIEKTGYKVEKIRSK